MATKRRKSSVAPRKKATVGAVARPRARRRVSAKNKSIKGTIAGLGLGLGVVASPITGKTASAVKTRSVAPLITWNKEEVKRTVITVGVGAVGGKIAGGLLNKIPVVKHTVNGAKKLAKGVF